MSPDPALMTRETHRSPSGEELARFVPYRYPEWPERAHVIEKRGGGRLLEVPGRLEKYRVLEIRDQHHATRYSQEEAVGRARKWGLDRETYKITKL